MSSSAALGRALASASLTCLLVVACRDDPTCYDGDLLACTCADGSRGFQTCNLERDGYEACVCDGTVPGLDTTPSADAGAAEAATGGKLGFLAPCTSNTECESGLCKEYPARGGSFCSKTCQIATASIDCPPPSPGCNNMGICKAP